CSTTPSASRNRRSPPTSRSPSTSPRGSLTSFRPITRFWTRRPRRSTEPDGSCQRFSLGAATSSRRTLDQHDTAKERTMNGDLGVWTSEECALVLIDYQKEQLESIRTETPTELVELHTRWLARTAKAFDVPIVLSTVGVEYGFNSPTQPSILAELPDVEPIDRTSMDSFEDQAFREAVEATGRKRLIIGGLQTEVCLAFAVVEALKAGYEVQFVPDATGSRTPAEHRTAIERMAHAGAVPNT